MVGRDAGIEDQRAAAAGAAAQLVEPGMTVGLGTGSTVAHLLLALARRELRIVCIATSPHTEAQARRHGLDVRSFDTIGRLDITIDGADQVADDCWLVKGGGGAHTREKIAAASADRFVVIISAEKRVSRVAAPVPLELAPFGLAATLARLPSTTRRDAPPSPDGGVLADYLGPVEDPAALSARLSATPGVLSHGLFPPSMVTDVLVGSGDGVRQRVGRR